MPKSTERADVEDAVAAGPEHVQVRMSGLERVGARLPLHHYLGRLWRYRDFIYFEARASVGTRNRDNLLGNVWLVLTPLLNGLTYFLVFGVLLQTSRGVENYLGFLVIGVFMFQFTSRCVTQGANSLVASRARDAHGGGSTRAAANRPSARATNNPGGGVPTTSALHSVAPASSSSTAPKSGGSRPGPLTTSGWSATSTSRRQ